MDLDHAELICQALGDMVSFLDEAASSWYKLGDEDILIIENTQKNGLKPLSQLSSVVAGLKAIKQTRIYVPYLLKNEAIEKIQKLQNGGV
jgi:hypothetical protein